jgi:biotin carboxyl carrier protein
MKIKRPHGTVDKISVQVGETVESKDLLVKLKS